MIALYSLSLLRMNKKISNIGCVIVSFLWILLQLNMSRLHFRLPLAQKLKKQGLNFIVMDMSFSAPVNFLKQSFCQKYLKIGVLILRNSLSCKSIGKWISLQEKFYSVYYISKKAFCLAQWNQQKKWETNFLKNFFKFGCRPSCLLLLFFQIFFFFFFF